MSPQRPLGVTLHRSGGETVPLELSYGGRDSDGIDVWKVSTAVDWQAGDHLTVGLFPAKCAIQFPEASQ